MLRSRRDGRWGAGESFANDKFGRMGGLATRWTGDSVAWKRKTAIWRTEAKTAAMSHVDSKQANPLYGALLSLVRVDFQTICRKSRHRA